MNCHTNTDFCHHPKKQGFDYFYGIPLTNLRDFGGETEPLFLTVFPRMRLAVAVTCIAGILLVFLMRRKQFIGPILGIPIIIAFVLLPITAYLALTNMRILNSILMRDYEVVEQPIVFDNLTKRLVTEGREFMKRSSDGGDPFLLVMSWLQVHTHLHTADEFAGRWDIMNQSLWYILCDNRYPLC